MVVGRVQDEAEMFGLVVSRWGIAYALSPKIFITTILCPDVGIFRLKFGELGGKDKDLTNILIKVTPCQSSTGIFEPTSTPPYNLRIIINKDPVR